MRENWYDDYMKAYWKRKSDKSFRKMLRNFNSSTLADSRITYRQFLYYKNKIEE